MKNKKLLIAVSFLFLFLIPFQSSAGLVPCGASQDDLNTPGIDESQSCQFCHLFVLLNNLITFFFTYILPITATALTAWGGLYMLTAGESTQKYETAKSIITAVVIGLVIILAAWMLLNFFLTAIGVAEWTGLGSWWEISCP